MSIFDIFLVELQRLTTIFRRISMPGPDKVNNMLKLDLSLSSMVVKVKRNNSLSYDNMETKQFLKNQDIL